MKPSRSVALALRAALFVGAALTLGCEQREGISVPDGFVVHQYAGGFDGPTALAFDEDGRLFVA